MSSLDLNSLKSAALVSRDFKREADRYLWHTVRIACRTPPRGMQSHERLRIRREFEEACQVAGNDAHVLHVRHLEFCVVNDVDDPGSPLDLELLFDVLYRTSGLRSLDITASPDHYCRRIAMTFSDRYFPFRLKHFCAMIGPRVSLLSDFLMAHPEIEILELTCFKYNMGVDALEHGMEDLMLHYPMPNLRALRVQSPRQIMSLNGSPITSLAVDEMSSRSLPRALPSIAIIGNSILHLRIRLQIVTNPYRSLRSFFWRSLTANMPHLRTLAITDGNVDEDGGRLRALSTLNELELFVWELGDPEQQRRFLATCSRPCRALRRAAFAWGRDECMVWYERRDRNTEWRVARQLRGEGSSSDRTGPFPIMVCMFYSPSNSSNSE